GHPNPAPHYVPDTDYDPATVAFPNSESYGDVAILAPGFDTEYASQQDMPVQSYTAANGFLGAAPRSRHVGGVNGVALDGHVGFLSDDIDDHAFAYLVAVQDRRPSDISRFLR
ncbi:MAG: DUF1559 domain-containing protein, partial [Planctomycetota bacterium]